ncbi:MAG: ribosome maturation factor RimP [Thermosynechococcaceae cyanobacterium MS004]|nr:ribosome maturation factor RimP [Thermosynechococcaceae cyanobacterium MS004]
MTHPLVPQILEIAQSVAAQLNLEVVNVVFHTHQNPPVLRLDVRNLAADTGLEDCEAMSRAVEAALDAVALIPDAYVLEVSSPGVSSILSSDRDFVSFRGFPVVVETQAPFQGQTQLEGSLVSRDEAVVKLTRRGRAIAIPRELVLRVQLQDLPQSDY